MVAITKISILLFYLRLFSEPWFRKTCYTIMGVNAVYGVGQILAIVLVCNPVDYNWTRWDGKHVGSVSVLAYVFYLA